MNIMNSPWSCAGSALWKFTIFNGKPHYFDWVMFNSYVKFTRGRYELVLESFGISGKLCPFFCTRIWDSPWSIDHLSSRHQTWLAGKSPLNGGLNRKITYSMFHFPARPVWLPDGKYQKSKWWAFPQWRVAFRCFTVPGIIPMIFQERNSIDILLISIRLITQGYS